MMRSPLRGVSMAVVLGMSLAGCTPTRPEAKAVDVRQVMREGTAARQEGNYALFRAKLEEANRLRPGHPGILYNLACARALSGDGEEALPLLERLAAMGLTFDIAADTDLVALQGTERFAALAARFERNGRPVVRSEVALTLEDRDMLAESVTRDPRTGDFFVSSVHRRRIEQVDAQGILTSLPASIGGVGDERTGGRLYGVMGMAIDPERGILWAASSAVPEMEEFSETDRGQALVGRYDLDEGRLVALFRPADGAPRHLFGDLAVHPSGDLYISDSATPAIYLLEEGRTEMVKWIDTGRYDALQGMAFSADGKRLFVADYSRGLFVIDREDRSIRPLQHPGDVAVTGIDGLYVHDGSLIGVQNGVRPNRVVRFRLDRSATRITGSEVLEANHPRFDDPTLGVIASGALFYVANSQWSRFSPRAAEDAVSGRVAPVILRLPL